MTPQSDAEYNLRSQREHDYRDVTNTQLATALVCGTKKTERIYGPPCACGRLSLDVSRGCFYIPRSGQKIQFEKTRNMALCRFRIEVWGVDTCMFETVFEF